MANTICILLVASLFVMSSAIPVNPGIIKGIIHKKAGETRGIVNAALGISIKSAMERATTEEQKACIQGMKAKLFPLANQQITQTTNGLLTMVDSHQAELSNITMDDVKKAADAMMANVTDKWVPEMVDEINKC